MNRSDMLSTLDSKPLSQLTHDEMHEARSLAHEILRASYYRDVRDASESIQEAIKDGEISDREELMERIHEDCDNNRRVMMTAKAIETLLVSDNDGAYFEDFGTEGMTDDSGIKWSTLAFCAFERDVIEQLESDGVDVNNFEEEEEEEEDGPDETD